ncbi:hypothetical protein L1987_48057 [Smallanthus sonchifolius]|uniref:Uncharacterized protein n=1 Tax=Smallanthus sonchifolius TaxID=185202 RepID=A0ACB9FQY1_9ASTR|nr:hypothetical protein L1987_48057 [Smallanthus sonchifolius]
MVMLCFLLDLRTLSPPLLRDLKQSLLQLANFYAISSPRGHKSISKSKSLLDRIGLCYVIRNRIYCSTEMKVAYRPSGSFSLRDFHHAVNNLPTDAFLPELNNNITISCSDAHLEAVLSDKVLYSWGGDNEDVGRKVIVISSCLLENLNSVAKKTLMDAADKCVSVDFVLLEQVSSDVGALSESINNFVKNICDLENCLFRNHLPDAKVLCTLVKQWLNDLRDEAEELQGRLKFKRNILGSLNQICCNLIPSFNPIIDEVEPCQVCRCHGYPLDDEHGKKMMKSTCPVTGNELGTFDLVANSLKVGSQTVLLMPSFHYYTKLQHVTAPVDFNVIERTNLGSLSEGLIMGTPFVVVPSTSNELDDTDQTELNNQVFQGLCSALHSLDQGLVCSSRCNTETMRETPFQCYYILLPSNNGVMLLRRLAGSEEVIPIADVSRSLDFTEAKDIREYVKASLLEIEVKDYNPIPHERGFHQKLNVLVKESLHFGSLPTKSEELPPEQTSTQVNTLNESGPLKQSTGILAFKEEILQLDLKSGQDKITARITEEWEQLVVNEIPNIKSPTCVTTQKLDNLVMLPLESNKLLDEKTSRILERLEIPRKLKAKVASPVITSSSTPVDACMLTKKPLIPFQPTQNSVIGSVASQQMKPNFQRLKRKK